MNDCVHSNTPANQQQDHVGDHAPTKIPWLGLCTDWFEIWRGVASWQRSVYKYELSFTLGGKKNKKQGLQAGKRLDLSVEIT